MTCHKNRKDAFIVLYGHVEMVFFRQTLNTRSPKTSYEAKKLQQLESTIAREKDEDRERGEDGVWDAHLELANS